MSMFADMNEAETADWRALLGERPPMCAGDEPGADDPELKAAGFAKITGGGARPVHVVGWTMTRNETFGPVLRVDYHDGEPDFPLRAIVWRKPDGEYEGMVLSADEAADYDGLREP
jgi:hypothetical protein